MANEKFSISEALKYGWEAFKKHAGFLIGFTIVIGLITLIPDFMTEKLFARGSLGFVIGKILSRLIGLLLGMAATRISLDLFDNDQADLARLGELPGVAVPYLVGKVLYGVIVLLGLVLLIVPGLIAAYMFLYVGYLIIDRHLGPVEALKESKALTTGVKWDLFLFSLVVAVINIIGVLCLFIGLVVTIPMTLMASVFVYRRLSPASGAAAA